MKKLVTSLFLAALTLSVFAASRARLDVSGGKIILKAVSAPKGGYFKNIPWGAKEKRQFNLTGETSPLPVGKWVKASFSFIPEADGKIVIRLTSNWSRSKGKKDLNAHWVYYDMVTAEGIKLVNGDFEKAKNGKPMGWNCPNVSQYITSKLDFISGKAAVKVWHNKRCSQAVTVKKGQKITITVNVKAGTVEAAKK